MTTSSSAASEFILIPSDVYNQLQRQPPEDSAVTIERQAVLANKHIPDSVKPKIIAAIDRSPLNEEEEPVEAEASTTEAVDGSTAMETSVLEEVDVDKLATRERIFKALEVQMTSPIKLERAHQTFDVIAAHKRITVEPHTQSFVVDGSSFNTIDVIAFLTDMQIYARKLSDAYIQLVTMTKIPVELLLNKYAKQAIQGKKVGAHISTSTPQTQPVVRRAARNTIRPTATAEQFSPIQRPEWDATSAAEGLYGDIDPFTDQEFDDAFHTPQPSPRNRRTIAEGNEALNQRGYTNTFR